jgi:hypothetical protein
VRKTIASAVSLAALILVPAGTTWAQTESAPRFRTLERGDQPSPAATLEILSWLTGRWTGEGLGGFNEEIWSEPRGGVMMGMYRHLKQDKPLFYEFLMFVEDKGTVALKLKHFNPDFTGWEEKERTVDFTLVKVEERAVHFNGLTFEREGDDTLNIYLRLRDRQSGSVREETFRLRRRPGSR